MQELTGFTPDSLPQRVQDLKISTTSDSNPQYASCTDWSDSLEFFLEQPPARFPYYLFLGAFAFTAIVGAWSWFGKVDEISVARGTLVPQGLVYKVQPSVAGKVAHVAVSEGNRVNQGQIIIQLDQQMIKTELERQSYNLDSYRDRLNQVLALIDQTQLGLKTVGAISEANIKSHKSALVQENTVITTNNRLLNQLQSEREAHKDRLKRLTVLADRGGVAVDQLFQVEQDLRDRDWRITEIQGANESSNAEITRLVSELNGAKASAKNDQIQTREKLQQLKIEANQIRASIQEAQSLLERGRTELEQTNLRSPVDGLVSNLTIPKAGEVAQVGQTIAQVMPYDAPVVLLAWLPSEQSGLVRSGMPVNVKLDSFPYQDYGVIAGKLITIAPDAQFKEGMGNVYRVEVALEQSSIIHEGKSINLRPGETGSAEVVVRQRRIISLILEPILKLRKGNLSL
ncbi:MAG: HlyD family efflux transporter periplasmic adaptor subunit [Nodosilinea sp. LVE1205-7]|jgi:HlyD family type I secretion membrane fusion protein